LSAPKTMSHRAKTRRVKELLKSKNAALKKRLMEVEAELLKVTRERDDAVSQLRRYREAAA